METKDIEKREENKASVRSRCDVIEKPGEILLKLEMPGVSKEGLEININGDQLEIRGKKDPLKGEDSRYLIHEIRDADYHQLYTIDDTIDRNRIDAALKNGVLTLKLSLKESEKPRRIKIKAE